MNWIKYLFSKKYRKQFAIYGVMCSCGKYEKCTRVFKVKERKTLTSTIYVDNKDHFKCGKIQRQIEKVKNIFNNYT